MTDLRPHGYGTRMASLEVQERLHGDRMHPEYRRRLFRWLEAHPGIGIGGGWRPHGSQPDRPGFAPEGRSFHQSQNWADGFYGYAAVDLVVAVPHREHRAPRWEEVPVQGSDEAKVWGVHANVGIPGVVGSEPWHIQPIEVDGYDRWVAAGRPAPTPNYPLPGDPEEPTVTLHPILGVMWRHVDHQELFWLVNGNVIHIDGPMRRLLMSHNVDMIESDNMDVFDSYMAQGADGGGGTPI